MLFYSLLVSGWIAGSIISSYAEPAHAGMELHIMGVWPTWICKKVMTDLLSCSYIIYGS